MPIQGMNPARLARKLPENRYHTLCDSPIAHIFNYSKGVYPQQARMSQAFISKMP
jgi:hypothetical protein